MFKHEDVIFIVFMMVWGFGPNKNGQWQDI